MEQAMTYQVTIDFKRGPSFGISVSAPDEKSAEYIAKREAQGMGFDQPVKKVTVRPD
jgi:hypothetical protein